MSRFPASRRLYGVLGALVLLGLAACSSGPVPGASERRERLVAVTADHELIVFDARRPEAVLERRRVTGLAAGERLIGVDFRVAKGVLYALSQAGRLYTLDVSSGALAAVGAAPAEARLTGAAFGFDFNPAADRIRVVSSSGLNLRLHPDTGALVDGDPSQPGVQPDPDLHYVPGDVNAGRAPEVVAAGYTYNPQDSKITTNYAIDRARGVLVMQGSREGATPVVSPNSGQLRTVGSLGLGPLADASFDISDVGNVALLAARTAGDPRSRLYQVDLESGRAALLGVIGNGAALAGMAIEP